MTREATPGVGTYRRDALLVAVGRMAPLAVQLLATPFVIRSVGTEAYAGWALMMTTINLLLTADLGVVGIMQRYHAVARGRADREFAGRITASVLVVLTVMLVVVTAAGPWIAQLVLQLVQFPASVSADVELLFRHAGTLAVLQLMALALSSYLAAYGRFVAVAAQSLGARLVLAVGIVLALTGDHGLPGLLLASYADAAVAVLIGLWLCRRHLFTEVRRFTRRNETRDLWSYAWRNQASAFGFVAQRELDVVMAGILLPTAALASMSAAAPLTAAACLAPSVLLTPLFTQLSVQAGADPARLADAAGRAERSWFSLVLPFSAMVLALLPFVAVAWLGPELVDIGQLTAVLAVGFLLTLVNGVRAILVRAAGRPGIESRSYLVYAIVKVVAGTALALTVGVLGLAAAGILAAIAALIVLRHGAGRIMPGVGSAHPSAQAWAISTGLLVGCGAAAWLITEAVDGRFATLGGLGLVGAAGAGVIAATTLRRTRTPEPPE